jgi:hypothetical protein
MKNIVLRNGLYAALISTGIPFLLFFLMGGSENENYNISEIIGYSAILLSMVFVFLGIKKYRDENNGGAITFWQGMKIGLLIVAIPSIAFGLFNLLYVEVLDPEFMDKYFQHHMDQAQAKMNAVEFEEMKAEMEAEMELFQKPIVQFGAMFFSVFLIGFIVTIISSIVLKRDNKSDGMMAKSVV